MNYDRQHRFYCGVDLHARTLFVHVLDHKGKTVFEQDLPADPEVFLTAIRPYRKDLVVGCECMFAWYWLADLCEDEHIPFALGHALAMKHIAKAKAKSDRIDAGKLAALLRGGLFPLAYAYPRAKRQTRDLLRRRSFFVRQRSQLIAHIVVGPVGNKVPLEQGQPAPAVRLRPDDRDQLRRCNVKSLAQVRDLGQAEPGGQEVGRGPDRVAGEHGQKSSAGLSPEFT